MKKLLTVMLSLSLLAGFVGVLPVSAAGAEYSIRKISAAPTLDGSVTEAEWGAPTYTVKASDVKNNAYITKVGTPPENDDFEFSVYYRWDDDNLYVAVTTKNAPEHASTLTSEATDDEIAAMWLQECLQITLDLNREGSTNVNHAEYGIAAANELDTIFQWVYAHKKDVDRTSQAGGIKAEHWTVSAKWDAAASGMVYELSIPWDKVDSDSKASVIKEGGAIRSGLSVNFPSTGSPSGYCLGTSPLVNKNTYDAPLLNLVAEDADITGELPVKDIAVRCQYSELEVGEQLPLTITVSPANADDKSYTISSSDESVISVDEQGNVTALKDGEATITVTSTKYPDVSGECKLTVRAKPTTGNAAGAPDASSAPSSSGDNEGGSAGPIIAVAVIVVILAGVIIGVIVAKKKNSRTE